MCSIFGIIDYGKYLSKKQRKKLLNALATEAEVRGIDATGIAWVENNKIQIKKSPKPAHSIKLSFHNKACIVMGHTRMTTQGSEKKNYNNHPFYGEIPGNPFALAHNGVINNDIDLQNMFYLPKTHIETDSYVAVQLLEKNNRISFNTLAMMAENLEGSYTITVLSNDETIYFVKGNNPLVIYHIPRIGIYIYASTKAILANAWKKMHLKLNTVLLEPMQGEIWSIDVKGTIARSSFDDSNLLVSNYYQGNHYNGNYNTCNWGGKEDLYLEEIKSMAIMLGHTPESIDMLIEEGFSAEEIETFLYYGEI
ncbi:class II glutamine amidotransferase [Anaerotignum sp.]|uniref:class II glutamine amidotransferase n=1 Tax=Anaerotignum sp. TaxID=2039241 RepID=UPI0028AA6179|nr:class II glutamine amidotransferase [Anaerotignum sp.]